MVREVTICTFAVEQFSKLLVSLEIEGGLCLSQTSQLTAIPTMPCAYMPYFLENHKLPPLYPTVK